MELGVNIDHVATLRQARRESFPDPIEAAHICEQAGCDSIVCHLREDRRHINDQDLINLRKSVKNKLNLEMSSLEEIVNIALSVVPDQVTLVPERREEITTEGGLDVVSHRKRIKEVTKRFSSSNIRVSLFIDPDTSQIDASKECGATCIELHTGKYANAETAEQIKKELEAIKISALSIIG